MKDYKEYYRKNREEILRKRRERYANNKKFRQGILRTCKNYREKNPEKYRRNQNKWREKNREKVRKMDKEYRDNLRFTVLAGYSDGQPKCTCCGESHIEFLTIDHIEGKGIKYGREKKLKNTYQFYNWLVKNNFPEGYQVLCRNCNYSLGAYGYCPHKSQPL